jgi:hypothetical protein
MIEGTMGGDGVARCLEEHRLASGSDPPEEAQLLVGQRATWGIVPELEEPAVDLANAIGELHPGIPGQALWSMSARMHIQNIAPLMASDGQPPSAGAGLAPSQ